MRARVFLAVAMVAVVLAAVPAGGAAAPRRTMLDKIAFYRGLVLAGRHMGWLGPVEPINEVLHKWLKCHLTKAEFRDLIDWSIQHRGNDYIPFGRRATVRSLAEFEALQELRGIRGDDYIPFGRRRAAARSLAEFEALQ